MMDRNPPMPLFFRGIFHRGDMNAFFGLALDNLSNIVILMALLTGVFGFPKEVVLFKMIPGTAFAVFIGDLVYTWMAYRLAKKEGRESVTAMPLGFDTPALFGYTFGILGPVFLATQDAELAWHVGIATVVLAGGFKILFTFLGRRLKDLFPKAALLGSIAAVAILLIAFLPSSKLMEFPFAGILTLTVILLTLLAKYELPFRIPGAFLAVLIGTILFYIAGFFGIPGGGNFLEVVQEFDWRFSPIPLQWEWVKALPKTLEFLPVILPFSLATVIGDIDVTASAEAAGDRYSAKQIIFWDGLSTILSGCLGGVLQTTAYIGHPAYKAMDARWGYTLFTALIVGLGGILGYVAQLAQLIPEVAVAGILVFIGIEIMSQAFNASPRSHGPAVALCFLPVIAQLVLIQLGRFGIQSETLGAELVSSFQVLEVFASGFIVSALLWGSICVSLIDHHLRRAAVFLFAAAVLSLFGVIHSPLPDSQMFLPWQIDSAVPWHFTAAYLLAGAVLWAEGWVRQKA